MFAKVVARRSVGKFHKTLLVALALIVLFVSLPLHRAYAWYYSGVIGKPGAVAVNSVYIKHYTWVLAGRTENIFMLEENNGPIVYRSPASTGAQRVAGEYTLERLNGSSWVFVTKQQFVRDISATQNSVRFPNLNMIPTSPRGIFRIRWAFAWGTLNGTSLGFTVIDSHRASDYVCAINTRPCYSSGASFQIGNLNWTW